MPSAFTAAHRGGSGPPLVCLHGFTDTWRTWELVLPALERRHEVLAPTLAGHAGGPPLPPQMSDAALPDAVERAMDAAGLAAAHLVGNSLGGFVALQLAARGRARSVVALNPAGGWAEDAPWAREVLTRFLSLQEQARAAAPHAEEILARPEVRRAATRLITVEFEHIPADLLAHQVRGVAVCATRPMVDFAIREGYHLDAERIACPVRIVWGLEDVVLPWPSAAERMRRDWLPHADWVELDGVGHCPQLDAPLATAQLVLDFTAR